MTVSEVGVRIAIPTGLAWSEFLEAADSIQTEPGQITIYLQSLAPGGKLEGRAAFALVSALPGNMVISAVAYGHVDASGDEQPGTGRRLD